MGFLDRVKDTKRRAPRRIMVYGIHGIGKSTFAAQAPEAVFIPCEDGLANIEAKAFPLATTYADVVACLNELLTGEHKFKSVVIDTLDELERLIHEKVCKEHRKDTIRDFGYGKGYAFVNAVWFELLRLVYRVREEKNMTVIFLAHAEIKRLDHPETESFDRFQPKLHKDASAMVSEWCDDVLFVCKPMFTRKAGGTKDNPRKIGMSAEEAVMRTRETAAAMAKTRISAPIPDEIPLSWPVYADWAWNEGKNQLAQNATEEME